MTSDRHDRLGELFLAASKLPPEERLAFLHGECGGDEELTEDVLSMLQADADVTDNLLATQASFVTRAFSQEIAAGDRIGQYEIVRTIGEGGMGVVYEAKQDRPQRSVAIKVLRFHGNPDELRRFELEAETLGALHHPGIAQVFEVGTADLHGREVPFFAMELVDGVPLDRHAEERGLGLRERLALMARVGDAVEHAHQRGVIHRDLKPGNVLVTADGQPKVLDFGIARSIERDQGESMLLTRTGQVLGTLAYMSPEQAAGVSEDIDSRSDVHALGAMTYQLLCGQLPYDLRGLNVTQSLARLGRDEPIPLLRRRPDLDRDMAALVSKTLERDPERRYPSVRAFVDDLRRYLADEPITARPPTIRYLAGKFVARHRGLSAGLALAFLSIVGGSTASVVYGIQAGRSEQRAKEEAERARQEAKTSQRVTDFLVELFGVADGSEHRGTTITAREILDQGFRRIERGLQDEPAIRARLMATMGRVYQYLSEFDAAASLFDRSLALRQANDATPRELAASLRDLGELHQYREQYAKAQERYDEALATLRGAGIEDDRDVARILDLLGRVKGQAGELEQSAGLHAQAQTMRQGFADNDLDLADSHQSHAILAVSKQDAETVIREFRAAIEIRERVLGAQSGRLPELLFGMARTQIHVRDLEAAEATTIKALELTREIYGDTHQGIGRCLSQLGTIRAEAGKPTEARKYYIDAEKIFAATFGKQSREVATQLHNLGMLAYDQQDWATAKRQLDRGLAIRRKVLPKVHFDTGTSLMSLGAVFAHQRDLEKAVDAYREAYAIFTEVLPPGHPYAKITAQRLGVWLEQLGSSEAATWKARGK